MRRFRTHWLALLGAMMLLTLSVSSAFGHHPVHADNRGNAVSTFVHELLSGSDEETDEEQDEEGDEEEGDEEEGDEEDELLEDGDNHGQCVREVAQALDLVGENGTHGWAVVEAAQVTCRDDGEDDATEGSDEGDEGDGDEESLTAGDRGDRGNSAAAHQKAPGRNKADAERAGGNGRALGHGQGHGNR